MIAAKKTTDGSNSQTNEWYYWAYLALGPFPFWLLPLPLALPGSFLGPGPSLGLPWALPGRSFGPGTWALGPQKPIQQVKKSIQRLKRPMTAAKKNIDSSNYQTSGWHHWANWALVATPLPAPPLFRSSWALPGPHRALPGPSLAPPSALPGPFFEIRVNQIFSSFLCLSVRALTLPCSFFGWALVLAFFSE